MNHLFLRFREAAHQRISQLVQGEDGQGMVEYALIADATSSEGRAIADMFVRAFEQVWSSPGTITYASFLTQESGASST